jgi:hypothetical protein
MDVFYFKHNNIIIKKTPKKNNWQLAKCYKMQLFFIFYSFGWLLREAVKNARDLTTTIM